MSRWQKTLPAGNAASGFTLIEVMVVIILIGLISSIVMVRGYHDQNSQSIASQLEQLLLSMSEKAVIDQKWYGLQLESNRYRLMSYTQQGWEAAGERGWVILPEEMALELEPTPPAALGNDIYLYATPDGLLSAYDLVLVTPTDNQTIRAPYGLLE